MEAPKGSLFSQLEEKSLAENEKEKDERYLKEAIEELKKGAPVIGSKPWNNCIESVSEKFIRGNIDRNMLPLSSKMVPLPTHSMSDSENREFEKMAMDDSIKISTAPMIAHSLYMFTPSLLVLMSANPSLAALDDIYSSCLEVARRWKESTDERERTFHVQNLIELQDIYELEKQRIMSEMRSERIWSIRTNAVEIIAHYRRIMNIIRSTNGFAGIDQDYATEMSALIHKCDRFMTKELQQLTKDTKFLTILDPLIGQIKETGNIYDLSKVNATKFQNQTINYTVEFVRIMERWILRVCTPHAHERFHFYHQSSVQIPIQTDLSHEEKVAIKNMRKTGFRAQSTYDPMIWPEFHRCKSLFSSIPASLKWPSAPPLPHCDRVTTANNIVACARILTEQTLRENIALKAFQAIAILSKDEYPDWPPNHSVVVLPNTNCPAGQEFPEILMGNPSDIF